jgi:L-threonylcarbamoyladenylate synthase
VICPASFVSQDIDPDVSRLSTQIEPVDLAHIDPATLARAAEILRSGGLVAFPTETVYGLGANALDATAVAGIFTAKGRPSRNPIIVHVANTEAARGLVTSWPDRAERLAARFWPGPLTMVLPKQTVLPDIVTAGGPNVGVRVPSQPIALALLTAARLPIAAPSANRSNYLSPTTAQHVFRDLNGLIDLVLDGGPTTAGIESTVIDLSTDPPRILRPGPISSAAIQDCIGTVAQPASAPVSGDGPLAAPGMLTRHYAPRATLVLASDTGASEVRRLAGAGGRVGWLVNDAGELPSIPDVVTMTMPTDARAYGARLYAALHELDDAGVDWIVVASVPASSEWSAIRDRLARAGAR